MRRRAIARNAREHHIAVTWRMFILGCLCLLTGTGLIVFAASYVWAPTFDAGVLTLCLGAALVVSAIARAEDDWP